MSRTTKALSAVFIISFVLFCVQCTYKVKEHIDHVKFLNQEETISIESIIWEITYVDRRKYFWVNIRNDKGEEIERAGRRKHCNNWRNIQIGSRYNLRTKYYTMPNSEHPEKVYVKVLDVRDICYGKEPIK